MYSNKHNAKRNTTDYATPSNTYTILFYPPTGASHKHSHMNPIKEKKKESRLPFFTSTTARPLRARASRLSSTCVSTTCTSRQRAPLDNVHLSGAPLDNVRLSSTCTSRQLSQVLTQTPLCSLRALPPHERPSARPLPRAPRQHVFSPAASALSSHSTLNQYSDSLLFPTLIFLSQPLHPALFWARCIRVRQSGGHAAPPPAAARFGKTGR